jgi:hypothetical protein
MQKKYIAAFLLTVSVIGLVSFWRAKVRKETAEYDQLLQGNARIYSLEFIKLNTSVQVVDPEILKDFEDSFRRPSSKARTGPTYNIRIILMSGTIVNTAINIYDDHSGYEIADYNHVFASDPAYFFRDFSDTLGEKTKILLRELTWKQGDKPLNKKALH